MLSLTSVFRGVLRLSVKASFVSLILIVFRTLFHKYPKRYIYPLWLFLLARLIFPFSIPVSFSLMPLSQTENQIAFPVSTTGLMDVNNAEGSVHSSADVLCVCWFIGMVALILLLARDHYCKASELRFSCRKNDDIYETDAVFTGIVFGLLRPRIYLRESLQKEDRDLILAHERIHLNRRDYLWNELSLALLTVHWFNPILWLSYFLMRSDMEMSCDEIVLENGPFTVKQYAETLLKYTVVEGTQFVGFREGNTKQRVMNILKKKTYSKYVLAVGLCIAVLLFLPGFFRSRTFAFDALYDSDLNEHSVIWSDTSEEYLYPVEHPEIHCGFNGYSGHNGIDISDKYYDDAVYSVAPGIVQSVGYHESTGYFVIIKHRNIISCYACLGEVFVKEGNIVSVDAIGTVDRSIHTKGHVHLVLYDLEGNYIKNAEELLHQR